MSLLGVRPPQRAVLVLLACSGPRSSTATARSRRPSRSSRPWKEPASSRPVLRAYVLPARLRSWSCLFAVQRRAPNVSDDCSAPSWLVWFVVIALLGLWGIAQHPAVLWALDPVLGLRYLLAGGAGALLRGRRRLPVRDGGGGALCRHGAFRPAADPAGLVGAGVSRSRAELRRPGGARAGGSADGRQHLLPSLPRALLVPLVLLATIATIIASQSIITGAFSMTRQAVQLGWLPRLRIVQTSAAGYGQIYVPSVNWLLMAATLGLAVGLRQFGQSRRRLRHRGVGDDADHHHAAVHRHARDLALARGRRRRRRRRRLACVDGGFLSPPTCEVHAGRMGAAGDGQHRLSASC